MANILGCRNILKNRKSVAFQLAVTVIIFVCLQSLLWIASLLLGGVLQNSRLNAYQYLYEKVRNRRDSIQVELKNRWMNVPLFTGQLTSQLPVLDNFPLSPEAGRNEFWRAIAPVLISMMRTTMSTGAFVVLNNDSMDDPVHHTLYFRDYDPHLNDSTGRDICMVVGPGELTRELKVQLDSSWSYTLKLNDSNRQFYSMPYLYYGQGPNSKNLGYWSEPFCLLPDDITIITYSLPLYDAEGNFRGVAGIEISGDYFKRLMPAGELNVQDSLGYLIGIRSGSDILPLLTSSAYQEHIISKDEAFSFTPKYIPQDIFLLENHNMKGDIFACVEPLALYDCLTPFESKEWYLIGLMERNSLLGFYDKILHIIKRSFLVCLLLAAGCGVFISYRFTKPIRALAKKVRESDPGDVTSLGKTGLSEIDDLSAAIEITTRNFLETGSKMSQIIELVNVPIGAFEYRSGIAIVFATDRLKQILSLSEADARQLYRSRELFVRKLTELMGSPEPDEKHVYKISDLPDKWVRINTVVSSGTTLGIATDVTAEIREKRKLRLERDIDSLTGLRSRKYFGRTVETVLLQKEAAQCAAILMLDLDAFKQVNDTYGHEAGDAYLRAFSRALLTFETEHSFAGRRSGDEFLLFFYGYKSREAIRGCVAALYKRFADTPFVYPDGSCRIISFSTGICWLNTFCADYDVLLAHADRALYRSKNTNKGRICEYDCDDPDRS